MRLGRYELMGRLSKGGMGVVYHARVIGAEGFQRPIAIKRIYPHLSQQDRYRRMFIREAKLAAQLIHPNIVQVYELGCHDEQLFIAMEYVVGSDLNKIITTLATRQETLAPTLVAVIAFDVLEALDYAHQRQDETGGAQPAVHQDLSPQNILVDVRSGGAKLCDFGVARLVGVDDTVASERLGKVPYMSPEQLFSGSIDARSDIYSLGVVLFEAFSGQRLFPKRIEERRAQPQAPPLHEWAPNAPVVLAETIDRALLPDPADRWQRAADWRQVVETYLEGVDPRAARQALRDLVGQLDPHPTEAPALPTPQPTEPVTSRRWTDLVDRAGRNDTVVDLAPPSPPLERTVVMARPRPSGPVSTLIVPYEEVSSSYLAPEPSARGRSRALWPAGLGAALLVSGLLIWILSPDTHQSRTTQIEPLPTPSVSTTEETADPPIRPAPTERLPAPKSKERSPKPAAVTPGESPHRGRDRRRSKKAVAPVRTALTPVATGTLTLNSKPWAYVTIDGKRIKNSTPLRDHVLPAGPHTVVLDGADGRQRVLRITIRANQNLSRAVDFDEPAE